MNLRNLIERIAWKRIAIFIIIIALINFYLNNRRYLRVLQRKLSLFWHTLTEPFISISNNFNDQSSEVFDLCVIAMVFITLLGVIKLLRQRR